MRYCNYLNNCELVKKNKLTIQIRLNLNKCILFVR